MQQEALFVGSFTAYVVAAHWVGKTLTTFQVSFISAVFMLLSILGVRSQLWFMQNIDEVSQGVRSLIRSDEAGSWIVPGGFIIVRIFLIVGAFFYMWQVRHPKTE